MQRILYGFCKDDASKYKDFIKMGSCEIQNGVEFHASA